jgi:hypothetical protein
VRNVFQQLQQRRHRVTTTAHCADLEKKKDYKVKGKDSAAVSSALLENKMWIAV